MFSQKTTAGDICTRTVSVAFPSLSIVEAARVMHEQHVGCLVIVEEVGPDDRQVVGMLTDRDIVTGVVAADRDPHGLSVADLMTRSLVTVREDDSLLDVLGAMRRKAVRRVPVVASNDRLIGLVALDDALEIVAEEMQAMAAAVSAAQQHERHMPR